MTGSLPSSLVLEGVVSALPGLIKATIPLGSLVLLMLLVRVWRRRPDSRGAAGERIAARLLQRLDRSRYVVRENLYLPRPDGRGTTQIDHVVISVSGIVVVETKNFAGWIFGDEESARWTQVLGKRKSSFQNPLRQNALHVHALRKFLGLPPEVFHSIVFFAGDSHFKTRLPPNVIDHGLAGAVEAVRGNRLSAAAVDDAVAKLNEVAKRSRDRRLQAEHVRQLRRRHDARKKAA